MKYILTISLATIFFITSCAQNTKTGFSIKGQLNSNKQADSIFVYIKGDVIASAAVINGAFELTGSISEPKSVALRILEKGEKDPEKTSRVGNLILENADYTFVNDGEYTKIKGGKLHDIVLGFESFDEFQNAVHDYEAAAVTIYKGGDYMPTAAEKQVIKEKVNKVLEIEDRNLMAVIENPKSPALAKAFAVERIQNWKEYPLDKRLALFDSYRKETGGKSSEIDRMYNVFDTMKKSEMKQKTVGIGSSFKDIEAKDINGKIIKLRDVVAKNKFTILEFWASWCGPCRGEIPNLKKAYAKYKSKGLEIYSISLDENNSKWLKALEEENTTWLNVVDEAGFKGKAAKDYGVLGVPASYLISQDGKIIISNNGLRGIELDKSLSEYIK